MTTEYSGRGDAERAMALLWGEQAAPKRGPKPGLSAARIVRAAVELADADGLEALSMRRVAERLGVGTMSLYTYVPGKAELLDAMVDGVLAEVIEAEGDAGGDWRGRLERRAREYRALYQRHPWTLQVSGARPLLGPNVLALYDSALNAVSGIGLSATEMVLIVGLVGGYVRGAAQEVAEAAAAANRTGQTDDEWWAEREPLLARYFDPERFPTVTAVEAGGGFQPSGDLDYNLQFAVDNFEFGLRRVLDGIAAFIAAGGASGAARAARA
jgi:AcrR family transcriptional regulator